MYFEALVCNLKIIQRPFYIQQRRIQDQLRSTHGLPYGININIIAVFQGQGASGNFVVILKGLKTAKARRMYPYKSLFHCCHKNGSRP